MHFSSKDITLSIALAMKLLLSIAQVIAGLFSNSIALVADALHNFADASVLTIALFAQVISRKPADGFKTFGYKKVEVVAALINLTTITLMGAYLMVESFIKAFSGHGKIDTGIVIITASIAFLVDLIVSALLYFFSERNLNLKAALLDSISDMLGAIAVLISAILIMKYEFHAADVIASTCIAIYILYHALSEMPDVINILIGAKPKDLNISTLIRELEDVDGVMNVHHVHAWHLDDQRNAMEAHVVIDNLNSMEEIKVRLKYILIEKYNISHSTLEFEKYEEGFKMDSCSK